MKTYKKTVLAVMGLSAALLGGTPAVAATLTGSFVSYTYDDADLAGFFGTASLDGDVLVFAADPDNRFEASVQDNDSILVPWTMHVKVSANTGYQLSSFNLAEGGSYTMGSADDFVDVSGVFGLRDVNNTNGQYIPVSFGASSVLNAVGTSTDWTAAAHVALPATGWDMGSVNLIVTNQLVADAVFGSSAFIAKEYVRVSAITSPVPEAQTYAMLLAGLGLVGFMARRGTRMAV